MPATPVVDVVCECANRMEQPFQSSSPSCIQSAHSPPCADESSHLCSTVKPFRSFRPYYSKNLEPNDLGLEFHYYPSASRFHFTASLASSHLSVMIGIGGCGPRSIPSRIFMRLRFPLSVVRISTISAFHSSSRPARFMTGRMLIKAWAICS